MESVCWEQVQEGDQPSLPIHDRSFVAHGRSWMPCAPACGKWWENGEKSGGGKPFVQGWTHTGRRLRRFFSAHVRKLNSHLKSLRNKRKERQKEQR